MDEHQHNYQETFDGGVMCEDCGEVATCCASVEIARPIPRVTDGRTWLQRFIACSAPAVYVAELDNTPWCAYHADNGSD